jgi:hypothetical protein
MNRRQAHAALLALGVAAAVAPVARIARAAGAAPLVEVWKTSTCGCCRAWVRHLEAAGFSVKVNEVADVTPVKERLGVPPALSSCHTAVVSGYLVEGHVPADDILRLLRESPPVRGILVPGMPAGSPGMEAARGERYEVLALDADGRTSVFATHQP